MFEPAIDLGVADKHIDIVSLDLHYCGLPINRISPALWDDLMDVELAHCSEEDLKWFRHVVLGTIDLIRPALNKVMILAFDRLMVMDEEGLMLMLKEDY